MIIGTVRAEEAKVFDSKAGQHDGFEVFWSDTRPGGWYWQVPEEPPHGPFARSAQAWHDAMETADA